MKWRGRRESTNIIDLRESSGVASFSVTWGDNGSVVIDTDGTVYGSTEGATNITLIPANRPTRHVQEWMPNMTIGQKNSLRELIQVVAGNSVMQDISPPTELEDVVLAQYVQSILNSLR